MLSTVLLKRIKHLLVAVLLSLSTVTFAQSELSLPLEELWPTVQDNSLALQRAQQTLSNAEQALGIQPWDNSRITASANTQADINGIAEPLTVATMNMSVPVSDSVIVGALLSTDNTLNFSASYQPFASDLVSPQMQLNYQQAAISMGQITTDLYQQLETTVLNLVMAESDAQLAQTARQIAEEEREVVQANVSAGTATTSDLLEAQKSETDAQQTLYSARVAYLEAQQQLDQLTGQSQSLAPELNRSDLIKRVEARAQQLADTDDLTLTSSELAILDAELTALRAEAEDIAWYESDLTLTAEYDVNRAIAKAGVSISLSPSQFRQDDMVDAGIEITLKQMELDSEQSSLTMAQRLAEDRIDIQASALESAQVTLAQRVTMLEETRFLFDQGEQTSLDVRQAEYSYAQAEAQVLSVLVAMYKAQSELFSLFD